MPFVNAVKNVLGFLGSGGYFLLHLLDHLALREEARDHVAVLLLHLEQVREGRGERHLRRVGAVHAADERLGEPVEASRGPCGAR